MSAIKTPSNNIFDDILAYDVNIFLKVIDLIRNHVDRLNLIISYTVTGKAKITIANIMWHMSALD